MALKLPEHSHCLHCGDPLPYGENFCDDSCKSDYEKEQKSESLRDLLFYGAIGIIILFLVYRVIL